MLRRVRRLSSSGGRSFTSGELMKSGRSRSLACTLVTLFVLLLTGSLPAQTSSGTLRGKVTDPTGAVIPQATVTATAPTGKKTTAVTDGQGAYELKGLSPGTYT